MRTPVISGPTRRRVVRVLETTQGLRTRIAVVVWVSTVIATWLCAHVALASVASSDAEARSMHLSSILAAQKSDLAALQGLSVSTVRARAEQTLDSQEWLGSSQVLWLGTEADINSHTAANWTLHDPELNSCDILDLDLTWLISNWTCTFGSGCRGIDATKPDLGCCVLGAHFTGTEDEAHVARVMQDLTRDDWEFFDEGHSDLGWVETDEDGDRKTRVVDGACVFLNRPGFGGEDGPGLGCSLHQKAWATGVEPWTLKPEVCWQLPIRRSYRQVTLPDGEEYLETTIAEYDRRGWGSGGHDLDWYCSGNSEAHVGAEPVYVSQRPELVELMGQAAYDVLVTYCEAHVAAASALAVTPAGRELLPLYVHPATLEAQGR